MKKRNYSLRILAILSGAALLAWAGVGRAQEPSPTSGTLAQPLRDDRPASAAMETAAPAASSGAAATSATLSTPLDVAPLAEGERLRLNFRGVSLDTVLEYLSKAAGFVIVRNVDVRGRVDVVSHLPLDRDEAVNLLNSVLSAKGYAAIRSGRVLTIVSREDAGKRNIPVRTGSDPKQIPDTDEMVTQIIPVRYANAGQLLNNLQPLLESYALMSANESGNAIVLTDKQTNIRRMAEIIQALDTSISRISVVKVFVLKFADATETTKLINELFKDLGGTGASSSSDPRAAFFARMRGGRGGPGGPFGGGDDSAQSPTTSEARRAATRLVAVADTRMNAVVVSGPDELLPTIEQLVDEVDKEAEQLKEIRVFTLKHANAEDMTKVINDIFQSSSSTANQQRGGRRGGRAMFMPFMGAAQQTQTEGRKVDENTVLAVADTRTNSVVVTAGHDLMTQIAGMVVDLDLNPAKGQKVHVYKLKNADGAQVETMLQEMFGGTQQTGRSSSTSSGVNSRPSTNASSSRRTGSSGSGSGSSGSSNFGGSSGR